MSSEDEQSNAPPLPPREHPLTKLGQEIHRNEYKPSPQEDRALQMCSEELETCGFNGASTMGILTLALTMSMGWKLKFFQHLLLTGGAAALGAELGCRYSASSCMKKILSLENDSPMRGELISIMRANFPNHPLLKMSWGQYDDSLPSISREADVYGFEDRDAVVSDGSAAEIGNPSSKPNDWAAMLGRGGRDSTGRNSGSARKWNGSRQDDVGKEPSGADILADPFDLFMQTGTLEEFGDRRVEGRQDRRHEGWHEKRRSRMSTKERRDHDRQVYAQRREQRQY